MRVKIGDVTFVTFWQYIEQDGKKITHCSLKVGDEVVGTRSAVCHVGDVFCKNVGRKMSLGRATRALIPTKEHRTAFWNAYRDMRHGSFM